MGVDSATARRNFLKVAGVAAGAALLHVFAPEATQAAADFLRSDEAKRTGVNIALELLRLIPKPGLYETLQFDSEMLINQSDDAIRKLLPDAPRDLFMPNPDKNPIDFMINQAMTKFEAETGIKPSFKKVDGYIGLDGWVEILKNSINSPDSSLDMRDGSTKLMRTLIAENLPEGWCKEKFNDIAYETEDIKIIIGTSLDKYTREAWSNPTAQSESNLNAKVDWVLKCRKKIFGQHQKPVLPQDLLVYFLKQNNGLVAPALWDLYTFVKAEARINYETGEANFQDSEDIKRKKVGDFVSSYVDEFSLHGNFSKFYETAITLVQNVDYRECLDLSIYDKIGAFHHAIGIAAAREFLPAEIIAALVVAANQVPGGNGGDSLSKSAADAYTTSRVGNLEVE